MSRKVNDLNKTAHKTKSVSKSRLQYLLHKAEVSSKQYKAERDTLIDDIAVLKANITRLEQTVKNKEDEIDWCDSKIEKLARENVYYENENKALRLQADTYFDEWQTVKNLYTTLTNHIRMKAENNPGVSRYIDLVNYIDRLESD